MKPTNHHPPVTRRLALLLTATLLAIAPIALLAQPTDSAAASAPTSAPAPALTIPAFNIAPLTAAPATLAAITTQKYPDADIVLVDRLNSVRYAPDGTFRSLDDEIVKILTEKGLREHRTITISYMAYYDEMTFALARIIHPDGTTTPIDIAANTKEMINRAQMNSNIYDPNTKTITLALPGLKVGDAYQVILEHNEKRPIIENIFSDQTHFENQFPIHHTTYEVRGPKTAPLRSIALLDEVTTPDGSPTITHTTRDIPNPDGTTDTIHTWLVRNVPQYFPEPSMPAPAICTQRVLVSTAADWREISQWYAALCKPHLYSDNAICRKVAELTAAPANGKPLNDAQKIRAIFRFVSQEIRYLGIAREADRPGYEPNDATLTFANRYGVCRDKAALLAAMLRVAGYDAYPVLINAGPLMDAAVPTTRFNHAITALLNPDNTYRLLDPTNETTADYLPANLANKSYLVALPEGAPLRTTPVAAPERNLLRAATTLTLNDDGSVAGTTILNFTGIEDNRYRAFFAQGKNRTVSIRSWLESVIKTRIPGATLTTYELTPYNEMDTTKPLRLIINYTAPDYFTVTRDKTLLAPLWFGANFSIANGSLGTGATLAKRSFPLEIPDACALDETLTINLPGHIGDTLALPDDTHIDLPAMTFDKTYTRYTRVIVGKLSLRLPAPQVAPGDEYAQLKTALRDIEYSNRQSLILAATPLSAAAPLATPSPTPKPENLNSNIRYLNDDTTCAITDAHSWTSHRTVREEILSDIGKKFYSELRIDYNPVRETVTLDHATVTNKDGSTRTVAPEEINIMDAPWNATAPRYPAGKTLIVAFPGVEKTSIIEYEITHTYKDLPWVDIRITPFGFDPVDNYTTTITAPADLNLTLSPELAAAPVTQTAKSASDTTITYTITGSTQGGLREDNLPPAPLLGPIYEATTLPDAPTYARLLNAAIAPLTEPTATIKQKAAALTADCRTDTARVTAIRDYVARNIREAGPNFLTLPLTSLTPAEKTLADGYGHQADRAILLAALLRAANLTPELLLIGPRKPEFYQIANNIFPIGLFNTLFVRVPADGKLCYPSNLSIYADLQSSGLDDVATLRLADGTLETIQSPPNYDLRADLRCDIQIAPDGGAHITLAGISYGSDHEQAKRNFSEMTPENHHRAYQQQLAAISQSATPAGKDDFEINHDYPFTVKAEMNAPRYATRSGDYLYFQLPFAVANVTPATTDTRTYPLFANVRANYARHWTITLPENTEIESAPEPLTWEGPLDYGTVKVETKTTTRAESRTILEVTQTVRLDPAIIPVSHYADLLEINRRLSQPAQWRVLLKTK